ncbi:MAG: TlpA family protein disulfide reductase [Candidatus Omnitrophica bacterium]|nr:TlpA family protein disulfide reductase [Candidatus Omnitrophota bacterium]
MANRYFKPLIVFIVVFLMSDCLNAGRPQVSGGKAVNFTLRDINNNQYTLSDYKGRKNVLLFFWMTRCPYCVKDILMLDNMYAELLKNDFELLSIDVGESARRINNFFRNRKPTFIILLDEDGSVAESYELLGVPTYVLIDKQGNEVFKGNSFPHSEYKRLISEAK